ncbi:N-glycosylase/DNA lyase-like [Macrosteles quadrilineatus]|uniref:N-glycosylase/DNA lyase-like n=1 Tax=Macrosteles quadrilineatus TaxID=74068 RepID=UPI0023E18BEC|nr:N-glycosylase/DNA lyase-like [Macrosteles quadrilineatus]
MKNLSSQVTQSIFKGVIKCADKELQLKPTLMGGQCFRWQQLPQNESESNILKWRGVFNSNVWELSQQDNQLFYEVLCGSSAPSDNSNAKRKRTLKEEKISQKEDTFEKQLTEYLRLNENLEELYSEWSNRDPIFKQSAVEFYGIRVLKQDPVENIFSFICSTNNNILRITSMVEKLCRFYGEKIAEIDGTEYYNFPPVSALAANGVEEKLRKEGFGYRAKYIHHSAKQILENGGETWLKKLQSLPYEEAKQQLMTLSGIGAKVADCICLMSLNHLEAIPVDTHVFQISQRYLPHLKSCKTVTDKVYNEIVSHFQNLYGKYAGWAHSVLFCADLRQFQSTSNKESSSKSGKGTKRKLKN